MYFKDKVEFFDSPRTLLSDEVNYNEFTQELTANNNVRIYQDTLSISCQRAKYLSGLKQGYLFDDVKIKERSRNLLLTGQFGFFDHEKNYARVTGDPVLTERDSTLTEITEVKGDTVEFFGEENRARVSRNVVIVREGLVATGSRVDYFTKDKYAELVGNPEALQNEDEISGDTMRMYFEGEKLKFVEVIGHAVATSPADSGFSDPKNRLEGKQMRIWLKDQKIDSVLVEGNAIANYFIREKTQRKGKDETSGDKLLVFFDKNKISKIRVVGGTKGQYIPERLTTPSTNTK
jgi:lipopolysaccharide export system protein LptA